MLATRPRAVLVAACAYQRLAGRMASLALVGIVGAARDSNFLLQSYLYMVVALLPATFLAAAGSLDSCAALAADGRCFRCS